MSSCCAPFFNICFIENQGFLQLEVGSYSYVCLIIENEIIVSLTKKQSKHKLIWKNYYITLKYPFILYHLTILQNIKEQSYFFNFFLFSFFSFLSLLNKFKRKWFEQFLITYLFWARLDDEAQECELCLQHKYCIVNCLLYYPFSLFK